VIKVAIQIQEGLFERGRLRTLTAASARQWFRADDREIPQDLDLALTVMLGKTKVYGFLQHTEFLRDLELVRDFGMWHGDHPPNRLSVVDVHLAANVQARNVPEWILLHNELNIDDTVGALPNFSIGGYKTLRYRVGINPVFVVWPARFAAQPPKPNRLGWLPQMEFGANPGQTDPRPNVTHNFNYVAMDDSVVHMVYP
jgi:hypothetical protein